MKMKNKIRTIRNILYLMVALMITSCVEGFKDDETWTSSVKNTTLESPAADKITVNFSADGTEQTITWPLIPGAGGYSISVYNVDDPDNPQVIGKENQVIDGISVKYPATEDTRYKIIIKTLGNIQNNNKEAEVATEKAYNNMLPVTAIIPSGTNLTEYFTANPIPVSSSELCYELVAGGSYSMTGNILLGMTAVTIRGDKVDHPKITMTDGSFVNDGAGFKLKFLDMDFSGFTGTSSNAVILMNATFNAAGVELSGGGYVVVPTTSPIALQACKINNMPYYLFYDNGKKYAIGTMLIKDCIIGQNTGSFGSALIRFGAGMLKDFTMVNSTLYNEVAPSHSSNRFMQISSSHAGNVKPTSETWANGSLTITNCTFWQAGKSAQAYNANGAMRQSGDKITIQKNVFVDSYENGRIINRFRSANSTPSYTGGENTQWYDGKLFTGTQDASSAQPDINYFTTDPQLTYQGNGVFKMEGSAQISARTGDPRWLPAQ